MLTAAAVLLLVGPIRIGDLEGYDDAVYAHISKQIVESGNWLDIESNGYPALEHPPGFVWMQAAVLSVFGPLTSNWDFLAKLPSAASGVGTVLLVYWLTLRLTGDRTTAMLAMFIMLGTPYFIKYTSHGMTDVPFTFLFTATIAAWVAAEGIGNGGMSKDRAQPSSPLDWYLLTAFLASYAMLTRGVVGLAVPLTFVIWLLMPVRVRGALPRRPMWIPWTALTLSFLPIAAWYGYQIQQHGDDFWTVQSAFLADKIGGDAQASWRQYTGAFEYLWMLLQSYWPWLPVLLVGLWRVTKSALDRDHDGWPRPGYWLVLIWVGVMFIACSIGGSRILRYLLPAYPAFSILAALGLMRLISNRRVAQGLGYAIPLALLIATGIATFPPGNLHAEEIRPIAMAATQASLPTERIGFWDQGQPRFDETGQMQWYGDRTLWILTDPAQFETALAEPWSTVWVVDEATYQDRFANRPDTTVVSRSGHLVVVKLGVQNPQ